MTTCAFCQAIKKMLDDLDISFRCIQADELPEEDRSKVIKELKKVNPKCSFPTVVIDGEVIVGYKVQEIKETIGIRTEVDHLYATLKKVHEPKGYYLNGDKEKTFELLRSLLTNKKRYGYMACPCRLASGKRDSDRNIICPCVYRVPDVTEYGAVFARSMSLQTGTQVRLSAKASLRDGLQRSLNNIFLYKVELKVQ